MKKIITKIATSALFVSVLAFVALFAVPEASAQFTLDGSVRPSTTAGEGVPRTITGSGGIVQTVINVLLWLIGIIAVIMLIIGGIRFAISGGSAEQTKAAKNTILYAVIGLVVAIFAYAIVNWVIGAVT